MIRSSKLSIKFTNANKQKQLDFFIDEYKIIVKRFIDLLWNQESLSKLIPKEFTSKIQTWLSARAIQCAGKQASGIIRGTKKKQSRRMYVYNKLLKQGRNKQARKLKKFIDKVKISKPELDNICPELDSRFVKFDFDNKTSFDGWITLTSLGNKLKIKLPIKKTKHFNKLNGQGVLKSGVRLSKKSFTLMFDLPDIPKKEQGETVGLDIGIKNVFTLSNGVASQQDIHGHTLNSISKKLSRKKKGSGAFLKAQTHRTNYINWSLNQINFNDVLTLKLERIKHLRKNKRISRYLSHFTYTEIYNKLEDLALLNGVRIEKINPTYTSQRCNKCGWVRKTNRKGKQFRCEMCKSELDSDLNAARNICLDLRSIGKAERLLHKNKKGFYWNEVGRKRIVSSAQQPKDI